MLLLKLKLLTKCKFKRFGISGKALSVWSTLAYSQVSKRLISDLKGFHWYVLIGEVKTDIMIIFAEVTVSINEKKWMYSLLRQIFLIWSVLFWGLANLCSGKPNIVLVKKTTSLRTCFALINWLDLHLHKIVGCQIRSLDIIYNNLLACAAVKIWWSWFLRHSLSKSLSGNFERKPSKYHSSIAIC